MTKRDQLNLMPCKVESVAPKFLPGANIDAPAEIVPAAMAVIRSVRMSLATWTAPSTFNMPAPCSNRLALGKGCAVPCRMALITGGVRPELACSISAAAPATAGAAIDVPLSNIWVWLKLALTPSGVTSIDAKVPPR